MSFRVRSGILFELKNIIDENIDVSKLLEIINNAPKLKTLSREYLIRNIKVSGSGEDEDKVHVGYFKDNSFAFYYPENLELLAEAGAELIPLSSSNQVDSVLIQNPESLDAVYIGGGFPEINLTDLAANKKMSTALKNLIEEGLPVYAECGGLMYLAKKVIWKEKEYQLAGILPVEIKMHSKPQGHGYTEALVDQENPFFEKGTVIKGHEFHYSQIYEFTPGIKSSLKVIRGKGSIDNRDGLLYKNVFASYIHIHALATPEWVDGMIKSAKKYKELKNKKMLIEG